MEPCGNGKDSGGACSGTDIFWGAIGSLMRSGAAAASFPRRSLQNRIFKIKAHDHKISCVRASPAGSYIGTCSADGFLKVWKSSDFLSPARFGELASYRARGQAHITSQ